MCQSCTAASHQSAHSAAELPEFASRLIGVLNGSALGLMISLGHRAKLFDVMASLPPSTSGEIARAAKLSERYVREWLGAMVTGGVILYDAAARTYTLPPEHAAFLTRAASPNNLATSMQWVGLLGSVETHVLEAFGHGRGVPYSAYDRFHEVMAEESTQTVVAALDEHILPSVPGLVARLTSGIRVLDVGCGQGRAIIALAKRFPRSQFTGIDFSSEAVDTGNALAREFGLTNVRLVRADAADYALPAGMDGYDFITTFDAIHDQARPQQVLTNIRALLSPGGEYLMQEIKARTSVADNLDHPLAPFLYTVSCMHCMSVSLASGGPGLGACWGRELAMDMLAKAGFTSINVYELPHDMINDYYLMRKG